MANEANGVHGGVSNGGVIEGGHVGFLKERKELVMEVCFYRQKLIVLTTCLVVLPEEPFLLGW